MKHFIVIFEYKYLSGDEGFVEFFQCQADDEEHAKEQTLDANPNSIIRWVSSAPTYALAYEEWINS